MLDAKGWQYSQIIILPDFFLKKKMKSLEEKFLNITKNFLLRKQMEICWFL